MVLANFATLGAPRLIRMWCQHNICFVLVCRLNSQRHLMLSEIVALNFWTNRSFFSHSFVQASASAEATRGPYFSKHHF